MESHDRLGPFRVHEVIGKGGTSFVYRGEHLSPLGERTDVAIKVMRSDYYASIGSREPFLREVRAVARLNHPCIVRLFDVGEIVPEDSPPPGSAFDVGRIYLVMQLVRGISLRQAADGLEFRALKSMLLDLLDALAHAHAIGVIHRDIKPSNVLVEQTERGLRLRLTDFGVARAREPDAEDVDTRRRVSGTPKYMAPEQVLGLWRDEGPWTDLYALGVVCWSLASGDVPFAGETKEVMRQQVYGDLPPFKPVIGMPDGFEDWLRKLLAKNPADRFRRAADAAYALLSLDGPVLQRTSPSREIVGLSDDLPTLRLLDTVSGGLAEPTDLDERSWPLPPIPMGWERISESVPPHLWGAGQGLYGLRTVSVVGRRRERTVLWTELRAVRETDEPCLVSLRGERGVGKTRLLDWLAVRSHELGAASVMRVLHSERGGPADGLGAMVERWCSAVGLDREQVAGRVTEVTRRLPGLFPGDNELLVDLIRPPESERGHRTRREVFSSLERFVASVAAERPVVLLVDDAQWGSESTAFARYIAECGTAAVLVVMALPTDAAVIEGELPVDIGSLAQGELERLTSELLGVSPTLARTIADHAEGSPLYAVEVVGGWVHSGTLVAGTDGFELADASAELPTGLDALWVERVAEVCGAYGERSEAVRASVDAAAVLGRDVVPSEWRMVATAVGAEIPTDLVARLVRASLAVDTAHGWSFAQSRIAEALVDALREKRERFAATQNAVARTLEFLYGRSTEPAHAVRRAEHAVAGRDRPAALQSFRRATSLYFHRGDRAGLEHVLGRWGAVLDGDGIPSEHPERWRVRVWHGRLAMYHGDFDRACELMEDAYQRAHAGDDVGLLALTARLLGTLSSNRDPQRADELYREALEAYREVGDDAGEAICLCNMAHLLIVIGNPDEIVMLLNQASAVARRRNDPALILEVAYQRGAVCRTMGRLGAARDHLMRAMDIAEKANWRSRYADILGDYADVLRMQGDLDGAAERMEAVLRTREALGEESLGMTSLNLALVHVQRGAFDAAIPRVEALLEEFRSRGAALFEQFALGTLLCAYAGVGRWAEVRDGLERYETLAGQMGTVDPDLEYVLSRTVEFASSGGISDVATRLASLVSFQRANLRGSEHHD